MRQSSVKRIDIAFGMDAPAPPGERTPLVEDFTLSTVEIHRGRDKFGMIGRGDLPVIRNLAGFPQPLDGHTRFRPSVNECPSSRAPVCSSNEDILGEWGARVRPASVGTSDYVKACNAPMDAKSISESSATAAASAARKNGSRVAAPVHR